MVDGERVRMGDILGDDQWWRHTSRPTKYFYSEDLRQFHRVNCIAVKGKVITAKLASNSLQVSSPSIFTSVFNLLKEPSLGLHSFWFFSKALFSLPLYEALHYCAVQQGNEPHQETFHGLV